jgi:hypothetical protein
MTLAEYGAESPPPITTSTTDAQGVSQCPVCDTQLDIIDTAIIHIPVVAFASDGIADICRRFDVHEVRSRGDVCPHCDALFPNTVNSPSAHGWQKPVGTRVERADGSVIRVPTRLEDFPTALRDHVTKVVS